MPYTFTTPIAQASTQLKIIKVDVQVTSKFLNIVYQLTDVDGVGVSTGAVTLHDLEESTAFTDFYNTWTTHQQLYDKVAELKGFTGTYSADDGIS
jgi:hypothetical protein